MVMMEQKKYNVAIDLLEDEIYKLKQFTLRKPILLESKLLARAYKHTGDFKKAVSTLEECQLLQEEITKDEKNSRNLTFEVEQRINTQEKAIKLLAVENDFNRKSKFYLIGISILILFIALVLFNTIRRKKRDNLALIEKNETISIEKKRSDDLLHNILPEEVAEELKSKGSADARQFDEVTVLFTDFKDFTKLSEKMTAKELVEEIHTCFKAFDNIMEVYGIEKIKTIGDSYMCAGGLPVANKTHAVDVVLAGLDIQQFILNRVAERIALNLEPFQIRIGIHTGPVVAGIVGIKKFAYDIWGDTVNTASRMESSGEAGKINISEITCELVKDKFNCIPRGKIQAKGKGELDMYFVERRI
jgi:class 3 adenylate cyclase